MLHSTRSTYTTPLDEDFDSAARTGGKAEGLRELIRAGFRVPRGFCVTADAFERIVFPRAHQAETLDDLRRRIREAKLPEVMAAEVRHRLASIGAERWAVRSSALGEDDEAQSFAGQQHTELDVSGGDAVLAAIRRVWAALYDLESLLYRERLRVDAIPRPMGVVVQRMLTPQVGGVLFTRAPTRTGTPELLVTADDSPRRVVEGRGGSSYYLDRKTGTLTQYVPGSGESPSESDEARGGDGSVPGPLSASRLQALARAAERLESQVGSPRDVEWAYDAEGLQMLQSRPITTEPDGDGSTVWTNANVGEALPGVGTPMTWRIIGDFSRRGFEQVFGTLGLSVPEDAELVGSFRGRVYLNLTEFISIASSIPILEPDVLYEMAGGGGLEQVRETASRRSSVSFLMRLPVTLLRIASAQLAMPIVAPLWSTWFDARIETFFERDLDAHPEAALRGELDRIDDLFDRNGLITLTCSSNFLMSYVAMTRWLEWFGDEDAQSREREFVRALEVSSAEPGLKLLSLGRLVRSSTVLRKIFESHDSEEILEALDARRDDPEIEQFLDGLEAFRREHGHRAPREAELATPRWREDDRFVIDVLQSYLEADELPAADDYRTEWREAREHVREAIDEGFDSLTGTVFRGLLGWARQTAVRREAMRDRVIASLDLYRTFALECGRRLAEADVLREPEDIFWLRLDEVRDWLDENLSPRAIPLRVLVREALVEALRELPDPPNTFVDRDGDDPSSSPSPESHPDVECVLEGLSGNRGTTTGRARVITHPDDGETVDDGDVLVAPRTDVGWTPLFLTASAVVMELGGPLSHACIVAREFGLPTVVNVRGALDCIETGDRVTVDGDRGVVYVHTS